MVILLGGASDMVRASIAEQLMQDYPEWRHLAIEDLTEAARASEEEYNEEMLTQIVSGCAANMQDDGFHLLVTLSDHTHLSPVLCEMIGPGCVSVHLGRHEEGDFDHVLDTGSRSMNDITGFLRSLIEQAA